tara:strand:+ start:73 stop:765 length:693 start_codon:yes stop_codon:yes gene_type:complete
MKKLLVVPTYNECENIKDFLVEANNYCDDILVVDDNSPDNTAFIVSELQKQLPNIHLLSRDKKLGLGSAYRDGFRWGLERDYTVFIQMDADFSHRFKDLTNMYKYLNEYELIIGSRYVEGGDTKGWSYLRRKLSKFANFYAKTLIGSEVKDMTSGFRIYSRSGLEDISYNTTLSDGYSFQIEMTSRSEKKNLTIKEVPITFNERREGMSKMDRKIVIEAIFKVIKFSLRS